jgi:hypothetical protein
MQPSPKQLWLKYLSSPSHFKLRFFDIFPLHPSSQVRLPISPTFLTFRSIQLQQLRLLSRFFLFILLTPLSFAKKSFVDSLTVQINAYFNFAVLVRFF